MTCCRWAERRGVSTARVAAALGVARRTVQTWRTATSHRRASRGRPVQALRRRDHRLLRLALVLHSGSMGVPTLQAWCPHASRRALTAWLRHQRQVQRRRQLRVTWRVVGRVWAMDCSAPPCPIDGRYGAIVHVRDLASRYYLAAMPVVRATARTVCDVLRHVTTRSAPPLVLKVDNGSPFGSGLLQRWAQRTGTLLLYSPPGYPAYNGSIEASIGALTARTHELAASNGHPERWTTEDLEAARMAANIMPTSAQSSDTPARQWQRATPTTRAERRRFLQRYRHHLAMLSSRAGVAVDSATRGLRRTAMVRTLDQLGYVSMRRRADLVHQLTKKKRQRLRT